MLPSGDWSVSVYRIFQEALTNVARHAAATRVDACLTAGGDALFIEIRDNGKGFDPRATSSKSCGIIGMRERALRLGGEVCFLPAGAKRNERAGPLSAAGPPVVRAGSVTR